MGAIKVVAGRSDVVAQTGQGSVVDLKSLVDGDHKYEGLRRTKCDADAE